MLLLQGFLSGCGAEDAQFARRPVGPSADDVRQEKSQSAVVVEPPDVDGVVVFLLKDHHFVDDALGQWITASVSAISTGKVEERGRRN